MVLLTASPPDNFFEVLMSIITNIFNSISDLFAYISSAAVFLSALPSYLPTVLLASFSFTMAVYTIKIFLR